MIVDIQEKMKQDVKSFEDLGTLIEHCLDNFENVILPKLPKTKVQVEQNAGPKDKKPLTFKTEECFDEKKFLRDFSKSKGGKEEGNVDFSELFDHCLNSYKKHKLNSTIKQRASSKSRKEEERSQDERKNPKEFKAFASSFALRSKNRRDLSDNVLDRNFRHQLQHKLHSKNQKRDINIQNPAWDYENKQNKKKDAAVRSEKEENKIKKSEMENRISCTRKTQPLQRTMQRKRLLGQ